jgi:hypothetical protein
VVFDRVLHRQRWRVHGELRHGGLQVKAAKLRIKKQTSDVQDRIERFPKEYDEFQTMERAQAGNYIGFCWDFRNGYTAADRRFDDLDRLFGFEGESQMRKTGVESSHWEGRRR